MKLILFFLAIAGMKTGHLKAIQGTWKPSTGELGGKALPKAMLDKIVLVIKDDTYDYDEGAGHDYGTLKEVGTKPPLGLDIAGTKGPNKGLKYLAIYKIEGSTLTICYGLDGRRPKSFTETDGKTLLMKYQRAK